MTCTHLVLCFLCASLSTRPCQKSGVLSPTPGLLFATGGATSRQEVGVVDHPFLNDVQHYPCKCVCRLTSLYMASDKPAPGGPVTFHQYTAPADERVTGRKAILWKGWEVRHLLSGQCEYVQRLRTLLYHRRYGSISVVLDDVCPPSLTVPGQGGLALGQVLANALMAGRGGPVCMACCTLVLVPPGIATHAGMLPVG
jgi:hypothetical protein